MTDPAAWLLANFHALGARRCAKRLGTTPEQVTALYREAVARSPLREMWPIAKAFWLYEHRADFTVEVLADMLSLPLPVVRERIELLEVA